MKSLASIILLLSLSAFAFSQQKKDVAAQNFTATTLAGDNIELNQLKGKVALLTFWSTKCQICVSEIPKLNKLVDKYADKNVEFIGLTMNNENLVNKFLKKKPFKFTIIPNSLGVVLKYADRNSKGYLMMGYPAYYLVNQRGVVVLKNSGWSKIEKLDKKIAELLKAE